MDKIYFTVNGEHYSLSGSEVSPTTSLNDYLRNYLQLYGTKVMCREGGCGACVVSVSQTHPGTKEKQVFSVNSCLVHILSCHQWDITTVEGVGNRKDGYHPIQTRLAGFNGTQCGYCTPGWVMNMYSLYNNSKSHLSTELVEKSFGGNLCRCTGYRPILDAFKSLANDAPQDLKNKVQDLEDLHKVKCLKQCERRCSVVDDDWCVIHNKNNDLIELGGQGSRWYKAFSIKDVFKVLTREGLQNYKLVAGNTGVAIFSTIWMEQPRIFVDISSIEKLRDTYLDENLVIGAGATLSEVMKICETKGKSREFKYLNVFHDHLDLVAHVPVRNIGTIGGNLALKNAYHEFPSDVFLLLETVQAAITIVKSDLSESILTMEEFLKTDLKGMLITSVKLPPLSSGCLVKTYKIMPRAQNALAIVNAGFFFKLDSKDKIEYARLVFSPISPSYVRAGNTEKYLIGHELFSDATLQKALSKLKEDLNPVENPPEASATCRKTIALGLFYKAVLSLASPTSLNPRYRSGASMLTRGISSGTQTFDTDKNLWPLNKPIPKLEALTQCSGEVKYSCDVVGSRRQVHVAFVLSTICLGEIESIDPKKALDIPGVVGFFTSKDIPGKNSFVSTNVPWIDMEEELLASKKISYYGQPIALVAAVNDNLALSAADLVKVHYKQSKVVPVMSIKEALVAPDKERRIRLDADVQAKNKGDNTTHVVEGKIDIPSQYHFTMETHCCSVQERDGLLHVRSSTQWIDLVHASVAEVLGIQRNKILVSVDRVGGGYGVKASRSAMVACACAVVARGLARDAQMVLPLSKNMASIGMRAPYHVIYKAGVDDDGVIQYVDLTYYSDAGYNYNDSTSLSISNTLSIFYAVDRWTIKGYSVITDKASTTWCRAPGTNEAIATLEHIMEHIAQTVNKDPVDVRIANLSSKHSPIKDMIDSFKQDSNYNSRKADIEKFNTENAWKKRGLKLAIMNYPIEYSWNFSVTITVYHSDGTISLSHGGIEMGQGINTKVAQVCAHALNVPLEKVSVLGSNSFTAPNTIATNGSITSDCVAFATIKACENLIKRFEPIKADMDSPTWEEVVKKAFEKNIDLQSSYMVATSDEMVGYVVYGVCATEVELDVLTGQSIVRRVDLLEDTGISISPDIDVGQIEGAFVMGLGLWTSENVIHAPTGRLLTDRTWTYHPPGARDIPEDFRISFRRNAPNATGVLRSKATGEPAITLSVTVCFALRDAIANARKEFGHTDTSWLDIDTPYSVENILKAIDPKCDSYKLK